MRLYISGKITGEDEYESKFKRAVLEVENMGYEAVNPCEIHDACKDEHTLWEHWMVCDIKTMLTCDGIYALRCWRQSRGAMIEILLARHLNMIFIEQGAQDEQKETTPADRSNEPV